MNATSDDLLREFPCVVRQAVAWGEMDAMGHVNNAMYFRYFESVRIAYFQNIGFIEQAQDSGVGPILAHTDCRFRIPLTWPDTISIGGRVTAIGSDRLQMQYRVVSHNAAAVAAEGAGRIVCFNYRASTKAPLPGAVCDAIAALEGRSLESLPWPPAEGQG